MTRRNKWILLAVLSGLFYRVAIHYAKREPKWEPMQDFAWDDSLDWST